MGCRRTLHPKDRAQRWTGPAREHAKEGAKTSVARPVPSTVSLHRTPIESVRTNNRVPSTGICGNVLLPFSTKATYGSSCDPKMCVGPGSALEAVGGLDGELYGIGLTSMGTMSRYIHITYNRVALARHLPTRLERDCARSGKMLICMVWVAAKLEHEGDTTKRVILSNYRAMWPQAWDWKLYQRSQMDRTLRSFSQLQQRSCSMMDAEHKSGLYD